MKFGVMGRVAAEEGRNAGATLDRLAHAESQGFDAVWIAAEDPEGGAAGRSLFAAAGLAERTQAVDVGLWSVLDPGLHPLRLAEDLAMLDLVSGGRLHWAPTGSDLAEPLSIILNAWSGEPFAHEGPRFKFSTLVCLPTPEQKPHPRLWLSYASGSASELEADSEHQGWLIDPDDESVSPPLSGSRALVFRMPGSMKGEVDVIRAAVADLNRRYAPDLLLVWPDSDNPASADAESLQNDFALACLESSA